MASKPLTPLDRTQWFGHHGAHGGAASIPATGFEMVWAFRSKVHPKGPVDCLGVGDDPQRGGFPEPGQLIVVDVVQLVFGEAEQENRPSGQMPRIGRICPAGLPVYIRVAIRYLFMAKKYRGGRNDAVSGRPAPENKDSGVEPVIAKV
jgi:hypothetical protein